MMNHELKILENALAKLQKHFGHSLSISNQNDDQMQRILDEVALRMQDNYPYFDNLYAGQMLKPPHPIARLAYQLALYINPNNHALDGGRASSAMEKEAVAQIAQMFGWQQHLGHLTGGGTMANMEALWVARKIHPDKQVVASEMAHYTHERISEVVGLDFAKIACNNLGQMDMADLEKKLMNEQVGTVVVTLGTTGSGAVDPLTEILELQKKYNFRIHIDAAYGGYFKLASNLSDYAKQQFAHIHKADSIVVDPHKHGLQPYGCGCILYKDPSVGKYYSHDSPYTYFSSAELHLGEISLECSRAGAAAVALWATMQYFPLIKHGEFAVGLEKCHQAALKLYDLIDNDESFITTTAPELDLVVWAPKGDSFTEISKKSNLIFDEAAKNGLHLALFKYPALLLPEQWQSITQDSAYVSCLRSCLMKHDHIDYVEKIWGIVKEVSERMV